MDLFNDILREASSNNRSAAKEINKIDETRRRSTKAAISRAYPDRKNGRVNEPKVQVHTEKEKPKFVIPKKKPDAKTVDNDKIALFLRKREEDKKKELENKKKEREELIKHRIQSNGGRVNKKIAKQFGTTPIELQKKYGCDAEYEEYLKKVEEREAQEAEELNLKLRGGVMKALERKKLITEKLSTSKQDGKKGPVRVGISKTNSMRHFTKDDSPECVAKPIVNKQKNGSQISKPVKQNSSTANRVVDFNSLMNEAEKIQKRQANGAPESPSPKRKKYDTIQVQKSEAKRDYPIRKMDPEHAKNPQIIAREKCNNVKGFSSQHSKSVSQIGTISNHAARSKTNLDSDRSKTVTNERTTAPSVRRYLPGDVRYNSSQDANSSIKGAAPQKEIKVMKEIFTATSNNNNRYNHSQHAVSSSKKSSFSPKETRNTEKTHVADNNSKIRVDQKIKKERKDYNSRSNEPIKNTSLHAVARSKSENMKRMETFDRIRRFKNERSRYDEDVEDNEYDSDMDSFIDDSEMNGDLERDDLEETLKLINPRYNKEKWKMREKMIDDRCMESSYKDISREERISAKLARLEDLREARSGKSIAL